MGLYDKLGGSSKLETEGVYLDLEVVRIKLARAGGGNKAYLAKLGELNRLHGKALRHDLMSDERSVEVMQELFANEIVKDWQYPDEYGEWITGVEQPDGSAADFNAKNVLAAFKALPNVWVECHTFANSLQYYNEKFIEDTAGK